MKQESLEIMRYTCAALPDRLPTSTATILQEKLETFPSEMLEAIADATSSGRLLYPRQSYK